MNPFQDAIPALSRTKQYLINSEEDEKEFNKLSFVVCRHFSYFLDTIAYANEMNRYNWIDGKMKWDFYYHTIRARKRFSKWEKASVDENAVMIAEYLKCSTKQARELLGILSEQQLEEIRKSLNKGGKQ